MLRPSMSQILEPGESYYMFVVAVAREARRIAKIEEEKREANKRTDKDGKRQPPLEPIEMKNPVTEAVKRFASKDLTLSEAKVSIVGQPAPWMDETAQDAGVLEAMEEYPEAEEETALGDEE